MLNEGHGIAGNRHGMTLIEVILTIVVMVIMTSGLFMAITYGTQSAVHAEIVTKATFLAQERMEEKIAEKRKVGVGYLGLTPAPGVPLVDVPATNYNRTLTICYWDPVTQLATSPCDNGGSNTGYKIMTVTVQYTQPLPYSMPAVSLQTLVTDY